MTIAQIDPAQLNVIPTVVVNRRRMAVIDRASVARMADLLKAHNDQPIMSTLGISLKTWAKIRNGDPIRASVADRLIRRLRSIHRRDA